MGQRRSLIIVMVSMGATGHSQSIHIKAEVKTWADYSAEPDWLLPLSLSWVRTQTFQKAIWNDQQSQNCIISTFSQTRAWNQQKRGVFYLMRLEGAAMWLCNLLIAWVLLSLQFTLFFFFFFCWTGFRGLVEATASTFTDTRAYWCCRGTWHHSQEERKNRRPENYSH